MVDDYLKKQLSRITFDDIGTPTLTGICDKFRNSREDEKQLAIGLHDFVKDNILFGFSYQFESLNINAFLKSRVGHSNPKTQLLLALLRECGFEAWPHFILVRKSLFEGLLPKDIFQAIPELISHVFLEVCVAGVWCSLDSYAMDDQLIKFAKNQLIEMDWEFGYGVHVKSTNFWDGKSNAFSQYADPVLCVEDHGRFKDFRSYYRSRRYPYKFMGITFSTWLQWLFPGKAHDWSQRINHRAGLIRQNKTPD